MAKLVKGDKFPQFTFDTAFKANMTTEQVVDGKQTFFWFLRYIGCTICRWDVHMLTQRYQEFVDNGVNVVVVMQSTPEKVQSDLDGATLPFYLICDSTQAIYKALEIDSATSKEEMAPTLEAQARLAVKREGVQAAGFKHGEYEGNEMQLPAFFHVMPDLTVEEAHYGKYIADIPTIDEMLAKIK
ncbi:MAG: redoxin domain-containing protein [Oscillospiraceae bacterium]